MSFAGTHPFVPAIGDDGPLEYCQNCGQHRRVHELPPPPPPPPPRTPRSGVIRDPEGRVMYTMEGVARVAGLRIGTVRAYRSKGQLPEPDGYFSDVPWWYEETILPWVTSRNPPGNPRWHKGMPSPNPRAGKLPGRT